MTGNVVENNLLRLKQEIAPYIPKIIAVTKYYDISAILDAFNAGLRDFGESRAIDAIKKIEQLPESIRRESQFHFIGHLQTNKVRQIVGKVDLIQSVDSVKLAKEISKQSVKNNVHTDVLVEVNIGMEESKSGVLPENLHELLDEIKDFDNISVKGLMTIPPICDSKQKISKYFDKMNNIFIDISSKNIDNISMDILSMGMSADYYEAILSGANMVRIGSSLFGARNYNK